MLTRVFRSLKERILLEGEEHDWKWRAANFGAAMKDLIWILEEVEGGINVDDYPRVAYQGLLPPMGILAEAEEHARHEAVGNGQT